MILELLLGKKTFETLISGFIKQTNDKGYMLSGSFFDTLKGYDLKLIKMDSIGNVEWEKVISANNSDLIESIYQTNDGGYILGGSSNSRISGDKTQDSIGNYDYWIIKLNDTGAIQWQRTIGGTAKDELLSIKQTKDNGYIIGGNSNSGISGNKTTDSLGGSDYWIIKLNETGDVVWQKTIGTIANDKLSSINQTVDNGYILGGTYGDPSSLSIDDYGMVKLDLLGNIVWQNSIVDNKNAYLAAIQQTPDSNYILSGVSNTDDMGFEKNLWLVKFNAKQNPIILMGTVFSDNNNNCTQDSLEKGLNSYTLKLITNSDTIYKTTQYNGNYYLAVSDTGFCNIEILPNLNYQYYNTSICNIYSIYLHDTVNELSFAMHPTINCPMNVVNISASGNFRRCVGNPIYISYKNNGTVVSNGTYIDVKLDKLLAVNTASIPYISLPDNTYRFIIGDLDYFDGGTFLLTVTPICDSTILGQTLCVEANIYPDTVCLEPLFTGSVITASAICLSDSVELQLRNLGNDMQSIKKYIVIEGNVMRMQQNYQLPRDGIMRKTLPANPGSTYRIIAEREVGFPSLLGDNFTTAAVENCEPRTNFSTGFFTQFPNYDGEPFRAMSCNVTIGSYDPNDKVASPVGYATQHYIEANTQIDYQINFQNTGNDTAFKVVVVDTISPTLDINSIQLGVGSHTYQYQRIDSNIIQFVFDSIMLVDSFKNERLSHGFIKFKIQQKLNNTNGTKIYNKAAIYFDYNAPIITNQTYHTIGRDFIQVNLITEIKNTKYNVKEVKVFPNPFREKTQIIVESNDLKNPILLLMNIEGKIVKTISSTTQNTFDIYREDLSNGIYIFRIMQENDIVTNGKLVVQ